ncbi:hypothetical protein OsJ_23397 [Oryza sativa Japonica Group]|uniref:Uncharacterized protein n=1 Tax=Oryza sativa subsp. japonica TaxID=39947 RepID=A3BHE0_ORYSJ|nr:hypothetical protein OsJ_23397 [Oryza sativa Japonica Group]
MADESNISVEDNPAEEINTTRESWESEFEDFHIPEMTVAEGTLYVTITSKLLVSEVMKKLRGSDPIYEFGVLVVVMGPVRKDCRKLRRFISKVVEKRDSAMHACSAFKRGWQITLDYMTSTEDTCNQICNSYFGLNNGNNVSGTAASILLDVFHLGEWIGETAFAGTADFQDTTERML